MRDWENNIRRVVPYTPGEQPKNTCVIKLNTNENPYPPAPGVKEVLSNFNTDDLRLYPDPRVDKLVNAIADFYKIDSSKVFVGVGSDDVLAMIFMTFFNSKKPILFPDITYSFYDVWADMLRIPYEQLPLSDDFSIVPSDYYKANGGVVFPNPNAPTGKLMPLDEIEDIIGLPAQDAPCISAKTGLNVDEVLERIVTDLPAPTGDENAPLQALIFDSIYDNYQGAIAYVRIKNGTVRVGDKIRLMASDKTFTVTEVGYFEPGTYLPADKLEAGEVGYIAASIKSLSDIRVGDTITLDQNPAQEPLPGYKKVNPMVYCGLYPVDGSDYENLKVALEKLKLNDAALEYEPETSAALGFGFRCGFLGLLHLEIIEERLDREFNLSLITTSPSVIYKVYKTDGTMCEIYNPSDLPPTDEISRIEEPFVEAEILTPKEYVGNLMEICQNRRGIYIDMKYLDPTRVTLVYELPLNEIIYDFFDSLKSKTKGYASFDYELKEYKTSNLVKLDILVNGENVDALSFIVHRDNSYERGKKMIEKLKTVIPRQLFAIPLQAAIGGKIIARETISAMRKDVLAKCYGGDVTRKKKLLEKQKRGKKKMREIGNVEVPQEAFLSVLKLDDE